MLSENIYKLVQYGIDTGLTPECERNYTVNLLLDRFKEDAYVPPEEVPATTSDGSAADLEEILRPLLDEAVQRGIISDSIAHRDLFDAKLMNCLVPVSYTHLDVYKRQDLRRALCGKCGRRSL